MARPHSGRVRPCEEAVVKSTLYLYRALPPLATLSVPLQKQIRAAVAELSQWSTYPEELASEHLSAGQCLLLALLHSLAGGQLQLSAALAEMAEGIPQLRSAFLGVWLADDYSFRKEWLAQAMSTAAAMLQAGSISAGSPVLAAFSRLPPKYGLAEHCLARCDIMTLGFVTYIANISMGKQSANVIQKQETEKASEGVSRPGGTGCYQTPTSSFSKDLAVRRAGQMKPTFSIKQHKSEAVIAENGLQINETRHLPGRYGNNKTAQKLLMWAVGRNIWTSASTALSEGADVNLAGADGHTPLSLAALRGSASVAEVLLRSGAAVDGGSEVFGATALSIAAMAGHDGVLRLLLDRGADAGADDDHGLTPLHRAAECGRNRCVMELLAAGASVNARVEDHRASTPLHLAAEQGHLEAVELLLRSGADPNAIDNYGWSALTGASIKGHKTVSEVLMANGCIDITRINKFLNPI